MGAKSAHATRNLAPCWRVLGAGFRRQEGQSTMSARILASAGLGLAVSACGYTNTTEVVRAPPAAVYAAPAPVTYVAPAPVATTYVTPAPVVVAAVPPATTPPAGVQAFRDEYGFRYDGQGNRLDRYGNIISPHSTRP